MSWQNTPISRRLVLTSLFCLVSANQQALAQERGGHTDRSDRFKSDFRHQFRNDTIRGDRHEPRSPETNSSRASDAQARFNFALRRIQSQNERESQRNLRIQSDSAHARSAHRALNSRSERRTAARNDNAVLNSALNNFVETQHDVRSIQGTASGGYQNRGRIDLDLTSSESSIQLGKKIFNGADSVTVRVGDEERTFTPGAQVTAGEYVAIRQKLDTGSQELILSNSGTALGGKFNFDSIDARRVNDLVIPTGIEGVDHHSNNARLEVKGDLTNFGSILAVSTRKNANLTVVADSITNDSGASIRADGNVTLSSTSGQLTNRGVITSDNGNISIASVGDTDINIKAEGGVFSAINGDITVRDTTYGGNADVQLTGGDYLSRNLNIYSGTGYIEGIVGDVTGRLNTKAGIEHFYANTETLVIGDNCITGDPTFANSTGNIQIVGVNTFGEAVAFLANGNITADNTAQIVANGFNVYMVAGAAVTVSAGPETSNVPGTPIGVGTTATVDFSSGNGGNVDLSASAVATIIDTSSNTGNAGNVVIAARANGTTGGTVLLNTGSTIDTRSTFAGGDAGSVTVLAGADPASSAVTVQLGSILADGGSDGAGGEVVVATNQPTATGGTTVTFNHLGQISAGGPIAAGANAANGEVSVASIQAAGNIDIEATALHNSGNIASSKVDGTIQVRSANALTLDGSGAFSLTGGGNGQILIDASADNPLTVATSQTFNPGTNGSLMLRSEDENGSIVIAPSVAVTINDGSDVTVGSSLITLGDGSSIEATGASDIDITSGGLPFPLTVSVPDNGAASIITNGGTIDFTPTDGYDLTITNVTATGLGTLNVMGGPVTTNTPSASTFVHSGVRLASSSLLTMNSGNAGGIAGMAFQPYVGDYFNGSTLPFFNAYDLPTVKALLQRLKDDGYTNVVMYGQGSLLLSQFYGPTTPEAGSNKYVIQAAHELGMTVSAAAFQQGVSGDSFNIDYTKAEIQYILDQAQLYPNTVKEIIVCNESIFGANSLGQLIQLITDAKAMRDATSVSPGSSTKFTSATLPITTRQRWDVLAGVDNNSYPLQTQMKALVQACEGHIYGNMYAYFDANLPESYPTGPGDQQSFTNTVLGSMNGTLNAFRTAFTNQGLTTEIRIGETGWPSNGLRLGPTTPAPALGNVTLAGWYLQAMRQWAASNNINTVYFQGYDQPWQTVPAGQVATTPGSSEGFFGLYHANGTANGQTSWTLTSIDYKFGSNSFAAAAAAGNSLQLSNAGIIEAPDIDIETRHLRNNGSISVSDTTGNIQVRHAGDIILSGDGGTLTRTGGGTGEISFTTDGANEITVEGSQTLDAGAGNIIAFNAIDDGASMKLAQGAVINLPTNNTAFSINTENLTYNGTIDSDHTVNLGTTVTFNSTNSSTIANSVGDLDLSGIDDVNVTNGHLALLAKGSIVNTGAAVDINLSNGSGAGANLLMIAGFSFQTVGFDNGDPIYALDDTSSSTGNVVLNEAGHLVNINTSGTTSAGKVEIYANGSVALGNVTAQGGTGAGGDIIVKSLGFSVANVDATSTSGAAGNVDIQSGIVQHSGVDVLTGTMDSGVFSIADHQGNISVGDVNTGTGSVLLQTNGSASAISFTAAIPVASQLSFAAGTGTLNLPSNVVTAQNDASTNGGTIFLSASTFNYGAGPLTLNAVGGASNGGTVSYINTNTAPLFIDANILQINNFGSNGGTTTISAGGDLTLDFFTPLSNAAPTGPNGNGADYNLLAGQQGPGNLLIEGVVYGQAQGNGIGGDISVVSNSEHPFVISGDKPKASRNGVNGFLNTFGQGARGTLSVTNNGGGVTFLIGLTNSMSSLTINTANAEDGSITLKKDMVVDDFNIEIGGKGKFAAKRINSENLSVTSESNKMLKLKQLTVRNLTASAEGSIVVTNQQSGGGVDVNLGPIAAGKAFSYTGEINVNTTGDITADRSISIKLSSGNISVGSNIITTDPNGSIELQTADGGNLLMTNPGGSEVVQSASVSLRSDTGDIGTIADAFRVDTSKLKTKTTGFINVDNLAPAIMSLPFASTGVSSGLLTSIEPVTTLTTQTVPDECKFVSTNSVSRELDAVLVSAAGKQPLTIGDGSRLLAPESDTTVVTPAGKVNISAGSVVLLVVQGGSVSVFDMHDSKKNAVSIDTDTQRIALHPGRHVTLTLASAESFHLVNPAEAFEYRHMKKHKLANGTHIFTSEVSVPSVIASSNAMKNLLESCEGHHKKLAGHIVKTSAVLAALDNSSDEFTQMLHPRVALRTTDDKVVALKR